MNLFDFTFPFQRKMNFIELVVIYFLLVFSSSQCQRVDNLRERRSLTIKFFNQKAFDVRIRFVRKSSARLKSFYLLKVSSIESDEFSVSDIFCFGNGSSDAFTECSEDFQSKKTFLILDLRREENAKSFSLIEVHCSKSKIIPRTIRFLDSKKNATKSNRLSKDFTKILEIVSWL